MSNSAFVVGPPVSGAAFFGRLSVLREIAAAMSSQTSVLLVGDRRIGKTSLLRQTRRHGDFSIGLRRPVFVDLEGIILPSQDTGELVVREVLRAIRLLDVNTTKYFERAQPGKADWQYLFNALRRLADDQIQLLFLFDEIDSAIVDGPPQTASMLRSLATAGHIVVATSYRDPIELSSQSAFGSPWWNVFRFITVGLLESSESVSLLQTLSERAGREFLPPEISFIRSLFGDHPYLLQAVGADIFYRSDFASCTPSRRSHVLRLAVTQTTDHLKYHMSYLINHLTVAQKETLRSILSGREVSDQKALDQLSTRGVVRGNPEIGYEPFCLVFQMFLEELFKSNAFLQTAPKKSASWEKITHLASKALDIGITKAIELSADKLFR